MAGPRILIVGTSSPNADLLADVLRSNGVNAEWTDKIGFPNPLVIRNFDVIYGIYLQTCSRYIVVGKLLGKRTMIHFVGSDAYWYARAGGWRKLYWRAVLRMCDRILYVAPHLMGMVGRDGTILPFPILTSIFQPEGEASEVKRDILYYCPSGADNTRIYRLEWITEYAKTHQAETVTIIGSPSHPANHEISLPNVQVIPFVPPEEMPRVYRSHRRLIRMSTEDGLPRMVHEALLCGLEVDLNGRRVTEVPPERYPDKFADKFKDTLQGILGE